MSHAGSCNPREARVDRRLQVWLHGKQTSCSGLLESIYLAALRLPSRCMVIYLSACLFLLLLECVFLWGRDQTLEMVSGPSSVPAEILSMFVYYVKVRATAFIHLFIHSFSIQCPVADFIM